MAQPSDSQRGRRLALVVATTRYQDPSLTQLRSPGRDADDLTRVLSDPQIGGFTVRPVLDESIHSMRLAIEDFARTAESDDLLLMYLSGHGIKDKRGRLFFAGTDTVKTHLGATGLEAAWLMDQLEDCRARSQVVILDCCFSGAFAAGAKGEDDIGLERHFPVNARGRVVLTASRGSEYSFEGEPVSGHVGGSVFTTGLVEGLRSGGADIHRTGQISVELAFRYAYEYVKRHGAAQHPQIWRFGSEGDIILGHSPATAAPPGAAVPTVSPHDEVGRLRGLLTVAVTSTDRELLAHIADSGIAELASAARDRLLELSPPDQPSPAGPAATPDSLARELLKVHLRQYDQATALRCPLCDATMGRVKLFRHIESRHDLKTIDVTSIGPAVSEAAPTRRRKNPAHELRVGQDGILRAVERYRPTRYGDPLP
jgi:hypothetical protein